MKHLMKKETSCRARVNADGMRTGRTALMFMAMLMLASCANQTSGNEASIEEEAVVPSLSEDISDVVWMSVRLTNLSCSPASPNC